MMALAGCQTTAHLTPTIEDAQTRVVKQPFVAIKQQKRPVVALVLGVVLSAVFVSLLPATLPVRLVPARLVQIAVGVLLSALLGSLFTLRRVLRIDPAEAIG